MNSDNHITNFKRTKLPAKGAERFPNGYKIPPKLLETATNVACKIAWSFHNTTRVDIEELISEAKLSALEGLLSYDNQKASHISTYIYVRITNRLIAFINIEKRYYKPDPDIFDFNQMECFPCIDNSIGLSEDDLITKHLNGDGQKVAEIIQNNKEKLAGLPPKMMRGVIVKLLREDQWSWPRIWRNIREMKQTLNEIDKLCII